MSDKLSIDLAGLYLDWVNNFLTIEKFAEHYGVSVDLAQALIKEGDAKHQFNVWLAKGEK